MTGIFNLVILTKNMKMIYRDVISGVIIGISYL